MQEIVALLTQVYNVVIGIFTDVLTTITGTPLLFLPVILAIFGGLVMFAIKKVRSMGVRAGGGRRRRR